MAFANQSLCRLHCLKKAVIRYSSTSSSSNIKKSVFVSQSKDIHTNLALENWLQRNVNFSNHHVLLIWQNDPCVTIGKSQNPWHEVNTIKIEELTGEEKIKLARRNGDEEAVYHDQGNLNMTFLTSKNDHDDKYDVNIIHRALFREYGLKTEKLYANPSKKIFNSSIITGENGTSHHCNLFVDIDKANMTNYLLHYNNGMNSASNGKMKNLKDENRKVTVKSTLKAIGWEYLRTTPHKLVDGGKEFANKQNGFHMINPTEKWFSGITAIRDQLASWDWCYGSTPDFTISRLFPLPNSSQNMLQDDMTITVKVQKGVIVDVTLLFPYGHPQGAAVPVDVITALKGTKFSEQAWHGLQEHLARLVGEKEKFITESMKQVISA